MEVGVTVASMTGPAHQRLGYVIVFEDLSDLLKAEKQAAWREVARRVAHEIKNPLTPIALSAERIKRHIAKGDAERAATSCQLRRHHRQRRGDRAPPGG